MQFSAVLGCFFFFWSLVKKFLELISILERSILSICVSLCLHPTRCFELRSSNIWPQRDQRRRNSIALGIKQHFVNSEPVLRRNEMKFRPENGSADVRPDG